MFETNSSGGAGRFGLRDGAWIVCLVLAVVGAVLCGLVLDESARSMAYLALGVLGVVAIAVGVFLERPGFALPWYALLAGVAMLVFGETARLGVLPGMDSAAGVGVISLAGHITLLVTLALIVRGHARGKDTGTLLDASMLAVGVGLAVWVCLLGPLVYDSSTSLVGRLVSVVDALYVAGFAWVLLASGRRSIPLYAIGAGFVAILIGDALYAAEGGQPSLLGWLLAYGLFGAAALHPTMGDVAESGARAETGFGGRGAALISASVLIVPVILAVQYLRDEPTYAPVIAVGAFTLFALSLVRLRGLARLTASASDRVGQAAGRESVLGASATALVAATDRRSVYEAALGAARALLARSGHANGSTRIALGSADEMDIVAASDATVEEDESIRLPSVAIKTLLRQRSVSVEHEAHPSLARTPEGLGPDAEHFLAPFVLRGKLGGVILVSVGSTLGVETRKGFEALGARVAVALERIEHTEVRHRRRSEKRFESLTSNVSDIVMVLQKSGAVRYASPAYARVLGHDAKDAVGQDGFALVHRDDVARVRKSFQRALGSAGASPAFGMRMRHADRSWRHVEVTISNLLEDPNVRGVVVNARDVTERMRAAEKLSQQTFYDPLTGLPNRDLLVDRLGQALARTGRRDDSVAVVFLNLDRFKLVNDSLGREAGDDLLVSVSKRLKASLRPEDTLARLGGDEFVVLMEDAESVSQVIFLAERVVKLFESPFMSGDQEAYTTISAGIAISRSEGDSPSELLRDADIAMQRAKDKGKSRYEVFDAGMGSQALRLLERDTELRRAIEREEFVVYYQPKLDLNSGRLHGFEALVRWEHPERGLVPPGLFIPLAEESGLIVRIGHWVLEEACRRAKVWQESYGADAPAVGVNLSAQQFRNPRLPELVAAVLEETRLPPDALLLEVTESAMMEDAEASSDTLMDLKDLGVRIAIDDFGTGYSSLAYLKRFPLDMLKIDRSFVNELGQDPKSNAIVEAVCALGNTLQMQVLAEGIETAQQATQLRALGCELGQGYFFARPLPQPKAEEMIARYPGARSST